MKKVHSSEYILRGPRSKEGYELLKYIQGNLRPIIYPLYMLSFGFPSAYKSQVHTILSSIKYAIACLKKTMYIL